MMNVTTIGGFGYGFIFYKLFALAFLLGLIFFIAWAIKNLKKDQLRNWAIALLAIGIVGLLLTASSGYGMHGKFGKSGKLGFGSFGSGMMMGGMMDCMQDEECHEEMEEIMHDVMGLEHAE